ncbi:hypothetical protein SDC9_192947 [bioreactor metagenome]|uniref:Uncharacterized protein n=1 Tax=bioreactor metagenome TaxID=1076179 RepID=A0A645I2J2_9ZZZZ
MKITLDEKAVRYIQKAGFEDLTVYVKGCSA